MPPVQPFSYDAFTDFWNSTHALTQGSSELNDYQFESYIEPGDACDQHTIQQSNDQKSVAQFPQFNPAYQTHSYLSPLRTTAYRPLEHRIEQQVTQDYSSQPQSSDGSSTNIPLIMKPEDTPPPFAGRKKHAISDHLHMRETTMDGKSLSPTSIIPNVNPRKKRRLRKQEPHYITPSLRSSTSTSPTAAPAPQRLHEATIAACALWLTKYQGFRPSERTMESLSNAFDEQLDILRQWYAQFDTTLTEEDSNHQTTSKQTTPDDLTASVCFQWRLKREMPRPPNDTLLLLSHAFGTSTHVLSNLITRNEESFLPSHDSGYQTLTLTDEEVTSKYGGCRNECNRKAMSRNQKRKATPKLERDDARPFTCTSRCGATFRKKDQWKRHEEINYPTRVWICGLQTCQQKPEEKRAFFRKDHFKNHLSKEHFDLVLDEVDIQNFSKPIPSNFSPECIFRDCFIEFEDWNERINHISEHFRDPWNISE